MDFTAQMISDVASIIIGEHVEADPDGPDRGGYHGYREKLKVRGNVLTHDFLVDEGYANRIGDVPEPQAYDKASALVWIDGAIKECEERISALRWFRTKAEVTTEFVDRYEKPGDE